MRSVLSRILRSYKDTPHGPSGETRTPGILLPKAIPAVLRAVYAPLSLFRSILVALWHSCFHCFRVLQRCLWSYMWSAGAFWPRHSAYSYAQIGGIFTPGLKNCTSAFKDMQVISATQAYQFLVRLIKEIFSGQGVDRSESVSCRMNRIWQEWQEWL